MQWDAAPLAEAVRFAEAHETPWPRDLRAHIECGLFRTAAVQRDPRADPRARRAERADPAARRDCRRRGATRGRSISPSRVAKSYLSLLAGLAVADGLIGDLDDEVAATVDDGGFDGPHNGAITWRHLLQQTSEWEGTLFGKSDVIDRNRNLAVEGKGRKGDARPLRPPGTFWEYNDVRVNRLGLALLRRFRRPLPEVFAERIMRPIGASPDWRWHGYRTSHGRDRRADDRVGGGRHALGRRHRDPRRGPGAHRPADAAPRRGGTASACCRRRGSRSR